MNTYTYEIQPFQHRIIQEIQTLPPQIYNYVIQQSPNKLNLTLPQLKRSIYRSVRRFIKDFQGYNYKIGQENELIKYYCFFETIKNFNQSQNNNNVLDETLNMGLHFHLFISSKDPRISLSNYTHYLFEELTSFPRKKTTISQTQFEYRVYPKLEQDFILYHTKQYKDYPNEMIFKNY